MGIKGYVKYIDNRDIFIHAVGQEDTLNELAQWCKKGRLDCKVEGIEVTAAEVKDYTHFDIQHT